MEKMEQLCLFVGNLLVFSRFWGFYDSLIDRFVVFYFGFGPRVARFGLDPPF